MDQKFDIHLVEEEEKSGWTILSTVRHEELDETKAQAVPEPDKDSVESLRVADGPTVTVGDKNDEEHECSDVAEEFLYSEVDGDADDEWTEYGADEGGEEEGSPFSDREEEGSTFSDTAARTYAWEADLNGDALGNRSLVQQQPVHKQGLIWRVSLAAILGLFGWAVVSSIGSGGKNFRFLKTHPCSLKEGGSDLSTM